MLWFVAAVSEAHSAVIEGLAKAARKVERRLR